MKGPLFKLTAGFLASMLLVSCSPKAAIVPVETKSKTNIQEIRVVSTPEKTEVFVVGEEPMTYTTFHLAEPDRLVVDVLGVGLGKFTEDIVPSEGPIRRIIPKATDENRVARLEMELSGPVQSNVRPDGSTLLIEAILPPELVKAEGKTAEKEEVKAPPAKDTEKPAEIVSEIRFDRKGGLQLVVVADGSLRPHPFYLDQSRLVIDLPSVKMASKTDVVSANDRAVKQVRVGEHLDKIRLVLDLLSPVDYSLKQEGNELRVSLKEVEIEKIEAKIRSDMAVGPKETSPAAVAPPIVPLPLLEKKEPLVSSKYVGRKISLDFQDAEIADIIRLIAEVSGLNIVLSDDVKGKMTLKLVNVPWDQALDTILKMNILGQQRDGTIIVISTLSSITQRQEEEAKAKETGMKAEDRVTRVLYLNYSSADTLVDPLKKLLSPRGDITVDRRTNTVIIKDIEGNMDEVVRMAKTLDTRTPQVSIEARIVQVSPKFNRSLGIQWGANYRDIADSNLIQVNSRAAGTAFGLSTPGFVVNTPASTNFGGIGFTFGRFTGNPLTLDLRLSAGESQGLTKIVSTPKITVLDNQEARITQGESIPFSTTSQAGTQTTFVDANITLVVTPHISSDGGIVMKINITKNAPGEQRPGASGPSILKKEATTNVLVVDGETVAVGGIQETVEVESIAGIPILMKIPILGRLFQNKEKRKEDSELLVFLTPKLVR